MRVATGMEKDHVSLIPSIVPGTMTVNQQFFEKTRTTKKGEMYKDTVSSTQVYGEMLYTWVNNDNPSEQIHVPWFLVGEQDNASRSYGSGLTYANRYFLLKYFNISTSEDDPDAVRKVKEHIEDENDKTVCAEIVKSIDKLVKGYISANPDKTSDIKEICKKHCKDANYFAIKEPTLAAALLEDINYYIDSKSKGV